LAITALLIPVLTAAPPLAALAGVQNAKVLCGLTFFGPLLTYAALSAVVSTRRPEVHGRLVSTRTWYGRRTLDLGELRRVRRLYVIGNGNKDWLLLTDAYGVHLRLERLDGDFDKLDALVRGAITPDVRVSANAAQRLAATHSRHRDGCSAILLAYAGAFAAVILSCALLTISLLLTKS
jgi:hypothetical protein